ncbi:TPA: SAM-dependent methyltransferase [Candidatus Woesearchaeota archaeon]|nr:SAM-dependent methyltransferase [Candidatus Woesearchaeota archaeon]HIH92271.1 SAM-dependent methyltransferase [Candidatus Woesearchaeota archaeon]HII64140.1 SAM-dependent methyltransferase [Candidatus Woesearchaeota archaeon]HIJ18350.1 SAM-dependent methyltransferase [Candidatus Woesearchaeota archaeon]
MEKRSQAKERLIFLRNFIRNPKEIGSITPSSQYLKKGMLKDVDFSKAKYIAEYGAGTGIFTKSILALARKDATLLCFETNRSFCAFLEKTIRDPRLIVINDSAEHINTYLKVHHLPRIDYILSSLPFSQLPERKKGRIMTATKDALSPKGKFILYRYTFTFSDYLRSYFTSISKRFVALNIPPTFIYICQK